MSKLLLLLVPLLTFGQALAKDDDFGKFVYCDCPDVEMDPGVQLDTRTACKKGNRAAAEVALVQHDNQLIATSLNLDLALLEANLTPEQRNMPLTIVADTVRLRNSVRWQNPLVEIAARKIRVGMQPFIQMTLDNAGQELRVYARHAKVDGGQLRVMGTPIQPSVWPKDHASFQLALEQLTDQFEYVLATTKSFDDLTGVCQSAKAPAEQRDLFADQFQWALNELGANGNTLQRLQLIRKYRGPILEGHLPIGGQTEATIKELSHVLKEASIQGYMTERALVKSWSKVKMSPMNKMAMVGRAWDVTEQLVTGVFHDQSDMDVVKRARSGMEMLQELRGKSVVEDTILEQPHTMWPKEFDFVELKNVITSALKSGQVMHDWLLVVKNLEKLYHLRNLQAALTLETTLFYLARGQRSTEVTDFRKIYEQHQTTTTTTTKTAPEEKTVTTVVMKDVPAHLLAAGLIEKQIWPSNQEFNNYAHLRVNDVTVTVDNKAFDFLVQSYNVLFHDLLKDGSTEALTGLPVIFPSSRENQAMSTPFARWHLMPEGNEAIDYLATRQLVDVSITFEMSGVHMPGLTGRQSPDCNPASGMDAFTDCKYGGSTPFYGLFDIVSVMGLAEINNLLALKYENQIQNGVDEGVTTAVSTEWTPDIGDPTCIHIPGLPPINMSIYVKMDAKFEAPKIQFPQNLEGFIELTYEILDGLLYERVVTYTCDEASDETGDQTEEYPLTGHLKVVVPLAATVGSIEEDGKVYLHFEQAALNSVDFSYDNPLGLPKLLAFTKKEFIRTFTQTELARLKFDPRVTPEFVRPDKFIFQTVCEGCTGSPDDEGYLITMFKTKSPNSLWIGHPVDPSILGLDHATPDEFNAVIFLASHIIMCDVYYKSFQESNSELQFAVRSVPSPVHPTDQILDIEYLTDMCIAFSIPELSQNDVTVHIYTKSFQFTPQLRDLRTKLDNTNPNAGKDANGKDLLGDIIGLILSGLMKLCDAICGNWWDWFNPLSACKWWMNIACWFINAIHGRDVEFTEENWQKGYIYAHKDTTTRLAFTPECFQFQFQGMDFRPEVDFIFPQQSTPDDQRAKDDMTSRIQEAMQRILSFSLTESESISLFAAVNLLFPGAKIMSTPQDALFTPGPIVMYGNIANEYQQCEDIQLPPQCGNTLQC